MRSEALSSSSSSLLSSVLVLRAGSSRVELQCGGGGGCGSDEDWLDWQ